MTRLRRTRSTDPGIRRRRRGAGFSYTDPDGVVLRGASAEPVLERLHSLAIPPAWTDVWIATRPNAHIQATGVDAAGRRQYLYHRAWRERSDREKFERMLELARVLPEVRRGVTRDLRGEGLGRDRVLAGAFRLLDSASLRVGSDRYADEHGSYGLTTLLCAHASVHDEEDVILRFPGKSGQAWRSELSDPDLAALIAALKRRGPRARLLAWRDADGRVHPLRPEDVNADIRRRTGGDFTAKDFRTLRGTAVAAASLARAGARSSASGRRRAITAAMGAVADALGNTVAVARASYVDPRIVDRYERGELVDPSRSIEPQLVQLLME
ncbi:MAG TPA: DNA topoisomerase IB [Microbacteriaceae bacterium]|nr:DNA topoisomerase IB [Microbacteriaceae bacterium]